MKIEYDCFARYKVSVWYGNFGSDKDFYDYISTSYSDRGEAISCFLEHYCISDFDEDYTERLFVESNTELTKQIVKVSYIENFFEAISKDMDSEKVKDANSLLFIFDCDISYMRNYDNSVMSPLGVYDYKTEA